MMDLYSFLGYFDLTYIKKLKDDKEYYTLIDQLKDEIIDGEFYTIEEIIDELDMYYHDYIYESLSKKGLSATPDNLYTGEEYYPDILDWCKKNNSNYTDIVECIVHPELLRELPDFVWQLSEEDWTNYCAMVENDLLGIDDYIGNCRIGKLCFDIIARYYDVGGVDTEYGYGKNNYPYDHADGESFGDSCISLTTEDFKKMAEEVFRQYIQYSQYRRADLREKASEPLYIW